MNYLIIKGIKYLSTLKSGTVYKFIDSKDGSYCLKYRPTSASVKYSVNKTSESGKFLQTNIDYYVSEYDISSSATWAVKLTLSHDSTENDNDPNFTGWITRAEFEAGSQLCMPEARLKFHPNGGNINSTVDGKAHSLNPDDNCSILMNVFSTTNPYNVNTLFNKTGHTGIGWTLFHPTDPAVAKSLSIEQDPKDDSSKYFSTILSDSAKHDYAPIYPNIYYYLYAQWKVVSYTITYYSQGSSVGTSTVNYQGNITLRGAPSAPSGKVFLGWDTNSSATTPHYDANGDFRLTTPQNISLYAIWGTMFYNQDKKYTVQYSAGKSSKRGVGYGGPRLKTYNYGNYLSLPGLKDTVPSADQFSSMYNSDNGLPRRPGYSFAYWCNKQDEKSPPGETGILHASEKNRAWYAYWNGPVQYIQATDTSAIIQRENLKYKGFQEVIQFNPASYDREVSLVHNPRVSPNFQTLVAAFQVIDEQGNTVPGSYARVAFGNDPRNDGTKTIILKANITYFLELSMEDWMSGYYFYVDVTLKPATNKETVNPNGGQYLLNGNSTSTNAEITFPSNSLWVGISSNSSTNELTSFNGINQRYPSLPTKQGYWFEHWIGTQNTRPDYITTLSSVTAHAIPNPQQDFQVKAIWRPNLRYIKYLGNTSTQGIMSDTAHPYNQNVTLHENQYQKYAHITFHSRKGTYIDDAWKKDANVTIDFDDSSNPQKKEITLHHTYIGWNTKPDGSGTSYNNKQNFSLSTSQYGDITNLYAQWRIETIPLPKMERAGFIFLGWFTEPEGDGTRVGSPPSGASDLEDPSLTWTYTTEESVNLYAHWDPIGLVRINTDKGWEFGVPYIYTDDGWKRVLSNTYSNKEVWELGTRYGQNVSNDQSDQL